MKLLLGLLLGSILLYVSSLDWRKSLKAVFFIVVIEGALRKWVLPQASDLLYFLKDVVLLGAYLKYFLFSPGERKVSIKNHLVNILVVIVTGWCFFQAFNPSLGSVLTGLLGVKFYLFYIPMMWMLPTLFQNEEELYKFLRSHMLLFIPVGLIGILQYFSPPTSWINVYAPGAVTEVATFGAAGLNTVRITGTFSYVNSYQGYLVVCFGLLIPLFTAPQPQKWRWATMLELLLVAVNILMNGSRTPVIASVVVLTGYALVLGVSDPRGFFSWLKKFLPGAAFLSLVAGVVFNSAFQRFWSRVSSNSDLTKRIQQNFVNPLEVLAIKELDGYGTGATHPATTAFRRILRLPVGDPLPILYEQEMGRVAIELGPIGFLLWYGLRVCIIISLWLTFWKLKRPFLRQLALIAFMIQLALLPGQLVSHHTFSVYYWFLSGFIFLLPQLEQNEVWRARQQPLPPYHAQFAHFPHPPYR